MKMKLMRQSDGFYEITLGYTKAYVIAGTKELMLVDTGMKGNGSLILEAINKAGLHAGTLKHIVLTQLHQDHTGSLAELKQATGATVYAHELEADDIEKGITMRPCEPAPGLFRHMIFPLVKKGMGRPTQEGCTVDKKLKGNELLELEGFPGGIKVIHTPGHTAGHICLLLGGDKKILIAGDVANGGLKPGYPMLFENKEEGLRSLKNLGEMEIEAAYFSHGKNIVKEASLKFKEKFG